MNDIDIEQYEAEDRAQALEELACGCIYDADYDETTATCFEHRWQARYVGGVTRYAIQGRPW